MNFGIRRSCVGLMFVGRNVQRECEVAHYRQLWRGCRRSTNYQPATSRSEPLTGNKLAEHRTTPLQLFSLRDLRAQQVRATSPSDHIPLGGVVLLVSEIEISEGPEPARFQQPRRSTSS